MTDSSTQSNYLVALLTPHTPFAEAIVRRQVERAGLDYDRVTSADVVVLGPMIVKAATLFVDPLTLAEIRRKLKQ